MAMTDAEPQTHPTTDVQGSIIGGALRAGWADFMARPTAGVVLIAIYPFVGLLLYRFAFDLELLPLLFPIASGFALVGPLAAAGLYEISRRREAGETVDGVSAFRSLTGEEALPIVLVGILLLVIYALWLGAAQLVYDSTMGSYVPETMAGFADRVLTTEEGWALIVLGCGVGFLFALVALAVGALSIPAIVDRGVGAGQAVGLSVRTFFEHPRLMLTWGLVVAAGLFIASIPAFLGLMVALPVFGHATWHLYRRIVPRP